MKKKRILILISVIVLVGIWLHFWRREKNTFYQAEPPVSGVSEADWVTLAEGEEWIPGRVDVIESDRYYWKDWKRLLNGTESENLYYATKSSWDVFVKKAHAGELKRYERYHSGGGGVFHTLNSVFCIVEQNNAGLQPQVEGVSQIVNEEGKSKVTLYVSYLGEAREETVTYYYLVKIPEGLPRVEEIVICPENVDRGRDID